jgi:23S rRNA pseudouridine1911/1915/1917 synthase
MQRAMQDMTVQRLIEKEYEALVEGVLPDERGRIELPIGPDPSSTIRVKRACRADGMPSTTVWEVMRRFTACTLVRAMPLTGRQHQIRVHLAGIGHPVWGDLLYKEESLFLRFQDSSATPDDILPARQCLHAGRVRFVHPLSGHEVLIESPLPEDFLSVLRGLS